MDEVVLSSKGQMVIPKELRESLGLRPGQRLEIEALPDGTMLIIPIPDDIVKAMRLPSAERLERILEQEREAEEEHDEGMAGEMRPR
jgi:AbrB family looped-hinge helix DNA binding protein